MMKNRLVASILEVRMTRSRSCHAIGFADVHTAGDELVARSHNVGDYQVQVSCNAGAAVVIFVPNCIEDPEPVRQYGSGLVHGLQLATELL